MNNTFGSGNLIRCVQHIRLRTPDSLRITQFCCAPHKFGQWKPESLRSTKFSCEHIIHCDHTLLSINLKLCCKKIQHWKTDSLGTTKWDSKHQIRCGPHKFGSENLSLCVQHIRLRSLDSLRTTQFRCGPHNFRQWKPETLWSPKFGNRNPNRYI